MRSLRSLALAALIGASLGAGALAAMAEPPKGGFAPDPPAHASRKQWTIELTARDGKVTADKATAQTLDKPAESARVFGRFAVELWVGKELLDRVRFNVPLMGDEAPEGNRNKLPRPRFDKGIVTHLSVRIADNPRASYLLIVDRESGDTTKLDWPPETNGRLVPWKNGLSEAKPGDFPDGGIRAAGHRDGGAPEAGTVDAGSFDAGSADAGHDAR